MIDILNVTASGRLGGDPQRTMPKQGKEGDGVVSFNLGVSKPIRPTEPGGEWKERTHWLRCSVFGNLANVVEGKLVQGCKVGVMGELQPQQYEVVLPDGTREKRFSNQIRVSHIFAYESAFERQAVARAKKQQAEGGKVSQPSVPRDADSASAGKEEERTLPF